VWPADPLKPETVGLDFYNGMPGVVVFLAELYGATGDEAWLRSARRGAAYLAAEMERRDAARLDAGLYTGVAGLALTFMVLQSVDTRGRHEAPLGRALELLHRRAIEAEGGVHWNGSHDIISGNAGIGLLLLAAHRLGGGTAHLELARRAAGRLIAVGEPARRRGGLMWYPSLTMRRNMPNFSHGTAGVAYFLATLYERTREQRFLDAALAGAAYLDAIAVRQDGGTVIHHHDGGGEDLFYLSWCHGPAGTARLFHRLHRVTGEPRWREWVVSLGRGMLAAGIPEQRTPGLWNNISQCCGNVGVGEFFLSLARLEAGAGSKGTGSGMIGRVVDDTLRRATSDHQGLRWVQAEHRVQPENLVAQTGYMQGAAGVGAFLLQLDAFERGGPGRMPLPDDPFAA
jgi:lantibiotic modifying enzyme